MDKSGPAFPLPYITIRETRDDAELDAAHRGAYGMSLRQWYAGMAMQGFLAGASEAVRQNMADGYLGGAKLAIACFVAADAMIAEGEK